MKANTARLENTAGSASSALEEFVQELPEKSPLVADIRSMISRIDRKFKIHKVSIVFDSE
jgi:hypothetical protein